MPGCLIAAAPMPARIRRRWFLEAHAEARFTPLLGNAQAAPDAARTINRVGFRRRVADAEGEVWEFLISPKAFKTDVCKGIDAKRTAKMLEKQGWLLETT